MAYGVSLVQGFGHLAAVANYYYQIVARTAGSIRGPGHFPHEVPEGAVVILFNLKSDVPLEWLLRFSDTLQGLPGLEGEAFQGVMVRPDVYQWYALRPDLMHKPWTEACIAAEGHFPFIYYKIEANSKEDADRIENVLHGRAEGVERFEGESLRRKLVIDD